MLASAKVFIYLETQIQQSSKTGNLMLVELLDLTIFKTIITALLLSKDYLKEFKFDSIPLSIANGRLERKIK